MKIINNKEKLLYYILPLIINLLLYLFISFFFSIISLKKILIFEIFIYFVISIYLICIYLIKKNEKKINLVIIYMIFFVIDISIMYIFIFKGNYNDKIAKLLVISVLLILEYLYEKLCKFRKKNNFLVFIKDNYSNVAFLLSYFILTILIFGKLCLNSNDVNYLENRSSYKFSIPKIGEVLDNTFQDNFENAIIDQMPINHLLKKGYNMFSTLISVNFLKLMNFEEVDEYIKIINDINYYKNYLVYDYFDEKSFMDVADDDLKQINDIYDSVNANMYLYFVETDSNNRFDTNDSYDTINILRSNLKISSDNIGVFKVKNFNNNYKNNFYKTDHHWNYKGSYRGYKQIAKIMNFEEILEPKKEICFNDIKFVGSKSVAAGGNIYFYDDFCAYDFEFPYFYIKINGENSKKYGDSIAESKNNKDITYGSFYGGDYAEIIFDNKNSKSDKNLLIYSNSFSNAINKLLASNYKKTYVVDGRHYSNYDMVKYIEENNIDDVLIISNNMLFWDNVDW